MIGTRWDVQSHEDQFSTGIPDLSFAAGGVDGWIELKQIPRWPARASTLVKPSKYTADQVNWLRRRAKKGSGQCFVFVRVDKEYFLFSYLRARQVRQGLVQDDYRKLSLASWTGGIDPQEFIAAITAPTVG